MYSHDDFHESYYEHGCSLIHEKDILENYIRGNSWVVNLKRWWYNLFLLSCNDRRSRLYYKSSHAMIKDRARHFRWHKSCIHPLSKFRLFWDYIITFVILSYKMLFHYNSSLIVFYMPLPFYFVGLFLEYFIILDVYINIKCGYVDINTKDVILDERKSFRRYCLTKLFIHVASAMPLHSLMFLRYGMDIDCAKCKSNLFQCIVTLWSLFSLPRVYEVTAYWTRDGDSFRVSCYYKFLRILVLGIFTMQDFTMTYDTIDLIHLMTTARAKESSLHDLLYEKFNNFMDNYNLAIIDIYRTTRAFLFFSDTPYYMGSIGNIMTTAISYAFFMWGIVELFTYMRRETYHENQIIHNKGASTRMAKCRQLPDHITSKLENYFDFNMGIQNIVENQNGLYRSLPSVLKKEILLNCYSRMLMRISYFSEWRLEVIESLVFLLKQEIYLEHDLVADSGEQGAGLVIVDVGVLAVYTSEHREIGHLIDGDYFGEISLVTDKEIRTSYVVAVTSCKVAVLEKAVFRKFMRDYPDLFFELKRKVRTQYTSAYGSSSNN